jgi:hypothetical protein
MAKGVRLGGPRGVAWAVGRSGGRASYPCSRKRGGKTGVRRAGAGLSGKAAGEVTRGRRREKGVGGPRRRGPSGLFLPLRAPGRFPLAQWWAVHLGWGPQRGLADPAAPGASASACRNRRGPKVAPVPGHQGLGPLGLQVAPGFLQGVGGGEEEDLRPGRQLQEGSCPPLLPASGEEDVGVQEEAVEPNGRGRQGGRVPPR